MDKLKMQTPDLIDKNIEQIAMLFPNVITEIKDENGNPKKAVDFDLLKQALSKNLVEGDDERYRLDWQGKKASLLKANTPINKTLRPCREESVNFDTTQNLYIEGDNFEVLKILQESYLGKVKMIYIDPPYNTGNDFIYKDDFSASDKDYKESVGAVDDDGYKMFKNTDTNGRFHSDWLSMMYERLLVARDLLTDDGVIFISIGDEELPSLRQICNEVFGEQNYRNCLSVRRHDKNLNRQFMESGLKTLNVGYENVLVYSKLSLFNFIPVFKKASNERATTGYWKGFWNAPDRPTMRYNILGFTPTEGQWKWKKETAIEAVNNYKVYEADFKDKMTLEEYWENTGKNKKFIKRNLSGGGKNMGVEHWIEPSDGILRNSNMLDILATQSSEEVKGLFDFPKNIELISIICQFSLEPIEDDLILDFFSGSATTAHAVMQLNAEDGGNRKFIMVQLPESCDENSEAFKAGYKNIAEIGKERIRRAGQKILKELEKKDDQLDLGQQRIDPSKLDIGFRVYKVDSTNMKDIFYHPSRLKQDELDLVISNIKEDRSPEDLLTQVILDLGLELSLPIETRKILNNTVFIVQTNALAACFDNNIDFKIVDTIADLKPFTVVFKDDSFKDDKDRINVAERFKRLSPETKVVVL